MKRSTKHTRFEVSNREVGGRSGAGPLRHTGLPAGQRVKTAATSRGKQRSQLLANECFFPSGAKRVLPWALQNPGSGRLEDKPLRLWLPLQYAILGNNGGRHRRMPPLPPRLRPQDVLLGHGDAAEHGPDDSQQPLVGAAQREILQVRLTVGRFSRGTVDRAFEMPRKSRDRARREQIRGDGFRREG